MKGITSFIDMKSPRPIMCSSPESDNCLYMFQSGSKYYLWNPIEGAIWEIVTSMNLADIVTEITKLGLRSLKIARVYQVSGIGKLLGCACEGRGGLRRSSKGNQILFRTKAI